MTGTVCAVFTCHSNSITAKRTGQQVSFFRFPKDPKFRKEWIRRCYRKGHLDPSNKRICSRHFMSTDFEDAIKAQLLDKKPTQLKPYAIPTKHLLKIEKEEEESPREQRARKKEQKALVKDLLTSSVEPFPISLHIDHDYCRRDIDHQELESQCNALTYENKRLKQDLLEKDRIISVIKEENVNLSKRILEDDKQNVEEILNERLGHIFTPNQISILLKKKGPVRWTNKEITKAFALKCLNKYAYSYVKRHLHYPLPELSTLERWLMRSNRENRVLKNVFRMMNRINF